MQILNESGPFVWRWEGLWRFYPDGRVPFTRREDDDLIQELVDASKQILSVPGFVRNIMENLHSEDIG